ncbi:hypothetical protein ACNKHT_13640 [Shigella flexneri]
MKRQLGRIDLNAPVATVNGSYSQSVLIDRLEPVFQGALSPVGGVNLANPGPLPKRLL